MINGRYQIIRTLGEGGSGEVLLVEDLLDGSRIAMKLLSAEAGEIDEDLFRHEFAVLSACSHPNLVRVFDSATVRSSPRGDLLGRHFYTMEFVGADDALTCFGARPDGGEKIRLLENAFLQSLAALEYIHGQGIVHFDVKPQNLLVVEGPEPGELKIKLTDFGFSESRERRSDATARGTPDYTAPEVIRGLPLDRRADLYSLGVTFFHLWEGRCPFQGSSPVELLKRVLTEEIPPVGRRKEFPSALPGLIELLCRKNPDERPAAARDVMMSFASSRHEEVIKASIFLAPQAAPVGREAELRMAADFLNAAHPAGSGGRVMLVTGEEGMGKSLFLRECSKRARAGGMGVVEMSPEALAVALTGTSVGSSAGTVATVLAGSSTPGSPQLLLIDGIDRPDTGSLARLRALLELPEPPLIVAAAGAVEDGSAGIGLKNEPGLRIRLGELSREDSVGLICARLGGVPDRRSFAEGMVEAFGGTPGWLLEGCRMIASALPLGVLTDKGKFAEAAGDLETLLASALEPLVAARYLGSTVEERRLLDWLSLFDEPPLIGVLRAVVPLDEARFGRALGSLETRGLAAAAGPVEGPLPEERRYRVLQGRLRQYVQEKNAAANPERHRLIARACEEYTGTKGWRDLAETGRQWDLAGERERARSLFESAADGASEADAHAEAAAMLRKALPSGAEPDVALSLKLARACFASDACRESIAACEGILSRVPAGSADALGIRVLLGKSYARVGENALALQHFEEGLLVAASDADRFGIRQEIVALRIAEGQYEEAEHLSLAQKELAARQGDQGLLAAAVTDLGIAQFYRGNLGGSLRSFQETLVLYRASRQRGKIIDALNNVGNVLSAMSDFRGALEKWKEALGLISEPGPQHRRAQIFNNIGIAHYKLREFELARASYEEARAIFELLGFRNGAAGTITNLGEVLCAEGDYERAIGLWNEALALHREMSDAGSAAQTLLQLTQVSIIIGDADRAGETLAEAGEIVRANGLTTFAPLLQYLGGSLASGLGRHREAAGAFREAERGFAAEGSYTGGTESGPEMRLLALCRIAGEYRVADEGDALAFIMKEIQEADTSGISPVVLAETELLLGLVSRGLPDLLKEKAIAYFRRGLSMISGEQVSELAWKISYELGSEYAERGQRGKAAGYFRKAMLVIRYFSSKFADPALRERYLAAHRRGEVLHAAEQWTQL